MADDGEQRGGRGHPWGSIFMGESGARGRYQLGERVIKFGVKAA